MSASQFGPRSPRERWEDDSVQFPRLISELHATQNLDVPALCKSMNLTGEKVSELFDRAERAWETVKRRADLEALADQLPQDLAALAVRIAHDESELRTLERYIADLERSNTMPSHERLEQSISLAVLSNALAGFKAATAKLAWVWLSSPFKGDEIEHYPQRIPDFQAFAWEVIDMRVAEPADAGSTIDYSDPESLISLLEQRGWIVLDRDAVARLVAAEPGPRFDPATDSDQDAHGWSQLGGPWADRLEARLAEHGAIERLDDDPRR